VPSKCLLIILDGLGDRPHPELAQQTPLQAAHTPNLDRLADLGGNGLYHAGCLGEPLPSEKAHFALFGYPEELFPGRGPVEALGAGVRVREGEVAVLAHFVSASNREGAMFVEQDSPAPGVLSETEELFQAVGRFEQDGVAVELQQSKELFGVLVLRGSVSPCFTDSNPMRDRAFATDVVPTAEAESDPDARRSAQALRAYLAWAFHRLEGLGSNSSRRDHGLEPINGLVTQRAGRMAAVDSFSRRTGLKGASIASGALYQGLARLIGLEVADVLEQGDPQTDLSSRLKRAQELLRGFDFVHLHSKAPDAAAHSKDCRAKREAVSALDRALQPYMSLLAEDPEVLTVVTSDHSTPSAGPLIHSGEPVPVLMRGSTIRRDRVTVFDEIEAAQGALGPIRGTELMRLVLNGLDLARLAGIREVPQQRLYWPGPAPRLRLD
jgi:2,3-bisphosphoglycerate-independent phosphoglycerate mutase